LQGWSQWVKSRSFSLYSRNSKEGSTEDESNVSFEPKTLEGIPGIH
jgi:hypothetical protein